MQACDASLQSYPILSHITRVAISETNGRAWDVCNRVLVQRFVATANRFRSNWYPLFGEEAFTKYAIGFYRGYRFEFVPIFGDIRLAA